MIAYYENRTDDRFYFDWELGEPGWAPHLHPNLELVYIKSGFADVTINNRTHRLNEGDAAFIFPYCVHSYQLTPDDCSNHLTGLMVKAPLTGLFADKLSHMVPNRPFLLQNDMDTETRYILQRLFSGPPRVTIELTQSYLQLLLALIWPALDMREDDHRQEGTPHRIIRYVMEHCDQSLQAKDVAAALNISPSHLARLFSQHLRMGFNEYVNQLRGQRAADMLRSTDMSITEIMDAVGFDSQSTFNRAFRKIHGMSPRDYRYQARPNMPTGSKRKGG